MNTNPVGPSANYIAGVAESANLAVACNPDVNPEFPAMAIAEFVDICTGNNRPPATITESTKDVSELKGSMAAIKTLGEALKQLNVSEQKNQPDGGAASQFTSERLGEALSQLDVAESEMPPSNDAGNLLAQLHNIAASAENPAAGRGA